MSRETFTEVKVITNSFPLLKLPSVAYAQYRVDFNPDFNEGKNFVKKREYVHHLQTKVANDIFGRHYFLYDGRELGYAEPELQKILGPAKTFYADLRSTRLFSPTEFIPPTGKGKLKTKTPCVEIKFTRTSGPLIGYQEISYVMGNLRNPEAKERRENVTNFLQLILRHNTNNTYPNNGKLLTVPTLVYGNGDRMRPQNGSWNVVRKQLYRPAEMKLWAIANFTPMQLSSGDIANIADALASCCRELGMNAKPPLVQRSLVDSASTQGDLVALVKECAAIAGRIHNINLLDDHLRRFMLVVILPEDALNLKAKVKYFGDITHGVPTQCLRVSKLLDPKSRRLKQPRQLNQYFNNVALKINARLRGVNVMLESKIPGGSPLAILSTQGRKTMIIGVDVSHPGPGVTNRPSVASLVFSLYQGGAQYAATTTIQKPRLEKVEQLASMFTYALNSYSAVMEGPPNTIVYYRDGVSEGEYTTIFEDEMAKLEAGFLEFKEQNKGKGPIPDKLQYTFIVVGKRHHTLLFPPTPDVADSTGNYIPGITVDTGVVQPFVPNFYLQSHSAIQGTSRSSHYIVLRNDTFPSLLEIERLSFELCHIYAKATRSVSIPAPVYYADLACGRGNFHFSPTIMGHGIDDSASFVSTGSDKYDDDYWKEVFRKVHVNLQPLMYFL